MSTEQGPLILVVDDYEDAREMYAEYLRFCGFRVAEARNGNEALEQAFTLVPDLILMDLSLPGMDGHALAGASESAQKAGCDSFVTKPCLPDDLVTEVRRMLGTVRNV